MLPGLWTLLDSPLQFRDSNFAEGKTIFFDDMVSICFETSTRLLPIIKNINAKS